MTNARDDFELLEAWQGGDERAGKALYERYGGRVCRFFANKVTAPDVAEDLAQRTWLACVKARDRIRSASFRAYLFGIACNTFREHLRRVVRDPVDCEVTSAHDLGPTASAVIGRSQENRVLIEALRKLPLDTQIIYELRFWEGLTVPEIAAIVDLPEGTVKTRLRRGLMQLAKEIAKIGAAKCPLDSTSTSLEDWAAHLRDLLGRGVTPPLGDDPPQEPPPEDPG